MRGTGPASPPDRSVAREKRHGAAGWCSVLPRRAKDGSTAQHSIGSIAQHAGWEASGHPSHTPEVRVTGRCSTTTLPCSSLMLIRSLDWTRNRTSMPTTNTVTCVVSTHTDGGIRLGQRLNTLGKGQGQTYPRSHAEAMRLHKSRKRCKAAPPLITHLQRLLKLGQVLWRSGTRRRRRCGRGCRHAARRNRLCDLRQLRCKRSHAGLLLHTNVYQHLAHLNRQVSCCWAQRGGGGAGELQAGLWSDKGQRDVADCIQR